MLVGTIDGAVDGDVPIDVASTVGVSQDLGKDAVPGAVGGIPTVAFPDCLPGTEVFSWEIAPGDAGPVSVGDGLDDSSVVFEGSSSLTSVGRQQWFDTCRLFVGENVMSLVCSHRISLSVVESSIKETRPRSDIGIAGLGRPPRTPDDGRFPRPPARD